MEDLELQKRFVYKTGTHMLPCSGGCGEMCERALTVKKATCFECKKVRQKKYAREHYPGRYANP